MKVELIISKEAIRRVTNDFDKFAAKKLREINIETYKGANNIRNSAMLSVPVDSGNLKGNIIVQKETSATLPTNKGIVYEVGTNVEYAPHVEYGTKFQRAQPYLRPAFLKEIPRYIAAIKKIWRSK